MFLSQVPVICRTSTPMGLLNINLRDSCVAPYHIQAAVTEQGLQCEQISSSAQIGDGKCMPEPMWVTLFHAGFLSQAGDQLAQHILVHWTVEFTQKQWRFRVLAIFSLGEIAPNYPPGRFAQKDDAALLELGATPYTVPDLNLACLLVNISDSQRTQFRGTEACIEQDHDESAIPSSGSSVHGEPSAICGVGLPAILGGFEECFDLLLGERLNRRILESRGRHALHRIGDIKFVAGPAEEGRQGHPEVANGFGRERIVTATQATGLVIGAQPGQEGAQILCRYLVDEDIADVFLPQLEVI